MAAQPLRLIHTELRPEHLASRRIEQLPHSVQVDGRVTDPEPVEVQHRGQPTARQQQVLRHHVAVVPAIVTHLACTRHIQRVRPHPQGSVEIDVEPFERPALLNAAPNRLVELGQRPTAVPPQGGIGHRLVGYVDGAEGEDHVGQVGGEHRALGRRQFVGRERGRPQTLQPANDGPALAEPRARLTETDDLGNRDR